ncbi:hypothetical protein L198_05363 [Cryptococcus wingfieldii CBS 7118]|uniref:Uncharacterized protein n=1 Tax=Cryptococcus wingfieldii CBS 7118 TaxID=1295528 RepID=A0A1E3IY72_9TREE|nr:hypothetical protein L198_05363 [Cryptococcus wingfieldii CBS 7118]ODN93498.1 hypothetical protein L198_05363 [Cryptococcus wingfieldii CBS 7118]
MTLGQSDSEAAKQHIKPDIFNVTGNTHGHGHDAFRQDTSGVTNALKPSGKQSLGDQAEQLVDRAQAGAQPNDTKSVTQQTRDYVTPGNDSAGAGGILNQIKNKITGNEHKGTH